MTLFSWSSTAAANGTADATINMAEGMAPSAVNDGVRGIVSSTNPPPLIINTSGANNVQAASGEFVLEPNNSTNIYYAGTSSTALFVSGWSE